MQGGPDTFGEDVDVGAGVAVRDRGEVELPGVGQRADPEGQVPISGTSGNNSSSGAPARLSGIGGPGTLAA